MSRKASCSLRLCLDFSAWHSAFVALNGRKIIRISVVARGLNVTRVCDGVTFPLDGIWHFKFALSFGLEAHCLISRLPLNAPLTTAWVSWLVGADFAP
jgi:hypothetical protein